MGVLSKPSRLEEMTQAYQQALAEDQEYGLKRKALYDERRHLQEQAKDVLRRRRLSLPDSTARALKAEEAELAEQQARNARAISEFTRQRDMQCLRWQGAIHALREVHDAASRRVAYMRGVQRDMAQTRSAVTRLDLEEQLALCVTELVALIGEQETTALRNDPTLKPSWHSRYDDASHSS